MKPNSPQQATHQPSGDQLDSTDRDFRLVGAHEIRALLGNPSRPWVSHLTSRSTFPEPIADQASGKVWLADDVEAWIAKQPQGDSPDSGD